MEKTTTKKKKSKAEELKKRKSNCSSGSSLFTQSVTCRKGYRDVLNPDRLWFKIGRAAWCVWLSLCCSSLSEHVSRARKHGWDSKFSCRRGGERYTQRAEYPQQSRPPAAAPPTGTEFTAKRVRVVKRGGTATSSCPGLARTRRQTPVMEERKREVVVSFGEAPNIWGKVKKSEVCEVIP